MIMRREWIAALAVAVAAAALYLGGLGLMPLTDRDEGEYAAAARAMITSGDYIVPTLNGRNYLEKPILIFWAVALGEELMPGETGARLPSALAAALLILGLGALVRLASGSLLWAVMSAAALAFTPLMALTGRACLTDSLLTLFTTASLGLFFLGAEKKQGGGPWHLAAWACLGLGFLTKGPVAVAVVLPPAFIYALWQGRLWEIIKESRVLWGLLIFCLINLPWYGMAFLRLGEEFWRAFFVAQNINRFSQVLLGHGGGLFYYLPVLLLGFFPFGAAALPALARALFKNPASARQADASARLRLLAAIAAVWAFAVFAWRPPSK